MEAKVRVEGRGEGERNKRRVKGKGTLALGVTRESWHGRREGGSGRGRE